MTARIYRSILFLTLLFAFAGIAFAQDEPAGPPPGERANRMRPNLFRELGLTEEQRMEIKKYNEENGAAMREAQQRFRQANRDLDDAIYSEKVEDALVAQRLKEFQEAQAEVARLRFSSELALRKLLTPEQLVTFRELRRRFAENRERMQRRLQQAPNGQRQMRRNNQVRQLPPPPPAPSN